MSSSAGSATQVGGSLETKRQIAKPIDSSLHVREGVDAQEKPLENGEAAVQDSQKNRKKRKEEKRLRKLEKKRRKEEKRIRKQETAIAHDADDSPAKPLKELVGNVTLNVQEKDFPFVSHGWAQ